MTYKTHIQSQDAHDLNAVVLAANITRPLVAVYCGSRTGNNPVYVDSARQIGAALARHNLGLVYGGASIGIMGAVADGVIGAGGSAVGVIPTFLLQKEVAHDGLDILYTTDTMHTRKALMAAFAAAFVVLPGGLGTLEEIMEIATWRQLYQHDKPMLIVNTAGFYDHLLAHLRHAIAEGFMAQMDLDRLVICQDGDDLIKRLGADIVV